jgi:hypothetical protein
MMWWPELVTMSLSVPASGPFQVLFNLNWVEFQWIFFSRTGGRPAHSFSFFWVIQVCITVSLDSRLKQRVRTILCTLFSVPSFLCPGSFRGFFQIFQSFQFFLRLLGTKRNGRIRALSLSSTEQHWWPGTWTDAIGHTWNLRLTGTATLHSAWYKETFL